MSSKKYTSFITRASDTVQILFIILIALPLVQLRAVIQDNGYRDIIVALPNDVVVEDQAHLINSLKSLFEFSSRVLYVTTKRRATFSSVTFLIPESWDSNRIFLDKSKIPVERSHAGQNIFDYADVVITTSELSDSKPRTLQFDGCGKHGAKIYIPVYFLTESVGLEEKSIEFIHYWAQYRYGLFPEGGFPSDERYPLYYSIPGSEDIYVTACTNIQIPYIMTNKGGESCIPETDFHTGKPINEECSYRVETENEPFISSIMYQQFVPQTTEFCEADLSLDKSHNPNTPSKHNALCSEEGGWFIVLRNPDFAHGKNQATKYKPEPIRFKYIQEDIVRVVVAVETSSKMNYKDRYNLLKNALVKFILYDLPEKCELGLVFFDAKIQPPTDKMVSFSSNEDKIKFLESAPFVHQLDADNSSSPSSALEKSIEMLNTSNTGGTIILITTNPELNGTQNLEEKLHSSDIRLLTIFFSETTSSTLKFTPINSIGSVVFVPESENPVRTLIFLYTIFVSAVNGLYIGGGDTHILLSEELPITKDDINLTFSVDDSTFETLTVLVSGSGFNLLNAPLEPEMTSLQNSSGASVASLQKQLFIPAWIFQVQSAEVGQYQFFTRRKGDDASDSTFVFITAKSALNKLAITGKLWTDVSNKMVKSDKPVKLFAELRYGTNPVTGANVRAEVYHPDGTTITPLHLLDNGFGDPDITKNDGIYSRYFTNYSTAGFYSIIVHFDDNDGQSEILYPSSDYCCGSFVPAQKTEPTEPFSRSTGPVSFLLIDQPRDQDVFPPNRILDLRVEYVNMEKMRYTLLWTAAGDDYDHGTATEYELKLFSDRVELRYRFEDTGLLMVLNKEVIQHTSPTPYGSLQQFTVQLPETLDSGHYFFAVRAVDDSENIGEISNTAEIIVENSLKNNTIECEASDDNDPDGATICSLNFCVVFLCLILYLSK